jgi:hypothetical protein
MSMLLVSVMRRLCTATGSQLWLVLAVCSAHQVLTRLLLQQPAQLPQQQQQRHWRSLNRCRQESHQYSKGHMNAHRC